MNSTQNLYANDPLAAIYGTSNDPAGDALPFVAPPPPPGQVPSSSDARTVNNVMRHEYRVLSDEEKMLMQQIKDDGLSFHNLLEAMGNSRELSVAKTKIEEAVMWAVKHITK